MLSYTSTVMTAFVVMATMNPVEGIAGPCCAPNQRTAEAYLNGIKLFNLYVDYSRGVILEDHVAESQYLRYTLIDLKTGSVYVRRKDGVCSMYPYTPIAGHEQCIPHNAKAYDISHPSGGHLQGYMYQRDNQRVFHVVTKDQCLTVMTKIQLYVNKYEVAWYRNVVPKVYDGRVFQKDLSDCSMQPF